MTTHLIMARPREGTVGETRRVAHLFPIPTEATEVLVSYCNERFEPDSLEQLHVLSGLPCEVCMLKAQPPPTDTYTLLSYRQWAEVYRALQRWDVPEALALLDKIKSDVWPEGAQRI